MTAKYEIFELVLQGPDKGNPFRDVQLEALFTCGAVQKKVCGFYDGGGVYRIRFMPMEEGRWDYHTYANVSELNGKTGDFICTPAKPGKHGPVRVAADGQHFCYDDGTPFLPFGTTAYAWTSQKPELVAQTLDTLAAAPFNKIRMSPLPKSYDYNHGEPDLYPFEGGLISGCSPLAKRPFGAYTDPAYAFDFTRPNTAYWQRFDRCVEGCGALGIEVDLILFYDYDRWGFAAMGRDNNLAYIRYVTARYGAYANIWWSMANEWDLLKACKDFTEKDWELYAAEVARTDPYGHLCSIHNGRESYDLTRPWITHLSLQKMDHYAHVTTTENYRSYGKPIVWDEVCYEGNIPEEFGNISGEEMTSRFWEALTRGAYCTHGETYDRDDEILWWAKGGQLHGTSPERIAFLRAILEERPDAGTPVTGRVWMGYTQLNFGKTYVKHLALPDGMTMDMSAADEMLFYLNFMQPVRARFMLHDTIRYKATVLDTWEMTRHELPGTWSGEAEITLPGKPWQAVLFVAVDKNE